MDNLIDVLNNKSIPENVKKTIISLYEPAVIFWGLENEKLILQTIKDFEIVCVNNLGEEIVKSQKNLDAVNGVDPNTIGLCVIIPEFDSKKIIGVRHVILLENENDEEKIANLLAHELFLHGVKSIIQPKINENILFMGLEQKQFYEDGNTIRKQSNNYGFEELSTYFGQSKLISLAYNITIDVDPILSTLATSLGDIIEKTSTGKLMLEAQLTKDTSKLERRFLEMDEVELLLTGNNNSISWNYYNELMDKFMNLSYMINSLSETDLNFNTVLEEYKNIFNKLLGINMQIFITSVVLDSEYMSKKKILK